MPTEPLEAVLDRDRAVVEAQDLIAAVSPLLRELVNNGTHVFRRCQTERRRGGNEDLPPLMLYYHLLEMGDGTETLLARSCVNPAVPLVRSMFEAMLQLDYILSGDGDYEKRSLSWAVYNLHKRIDARKGLHPDTDNGRKFREANEASDHPLDMPNRDELNREIEEFESTLADDQLTEVEEEYQERRRALGGRKPPPYALFGGPANLRELAYRLSWGPHYDMLYPGWSEVVHATVFRRFLTTRSDGQAAVWPLRNPEEMPFLANVTALILVRATRMLIEEFRPGEDLGSWYRREVEPLWERLRNLRVNFRDGSE